MKPYLNFPVLCRLFYNDYNTRETINLFKQKQQGYIVFYLNMQTHFQAKTFSHCQPSISPPSVVYFASINSSTNNSVRFTIQKNTKEKGAFVNQLFHPIQFIIFSDSFGNRTIWMEDLCRLKCCAIYNFKPKEKQNFYFQNYIESKQKQRGRMCSHL